MRVLVRSRRPGRAFSLPVLSALACSYSAGLAIYYILFGTQRRMHSPEAATRWRSENYGSSQSGRASGASSARDDSSALHGRASNLPGASLPSVVGSDDSQSAMEVEFQHQQGQQHEEKRRQSIRCSKSRHRRKSNVEGRKRK